MTWNEKAARRLIDSQEARILSLFQQHERSERNKTNYIAKSLTSEKDQHVRQPAPAYIQH